MPGIRTGLARWLRGVSPAAAPICFLAAVHAQADAPEATQPAGAAEARQYGGLLGFVNRLPELINATLPKTEPGGSYWFYARPRFGDPFKGSYFRLDGGGWLKVTDRVDVNAGAQEYVWRDTNDNNATREGFYSVNAGVKYERTLASPAGSAMAAGVNFSTPISRPPIALVDGYRHTDPFFSYSRPLNPRIRLVGFATVGVDLLARSPLPGNFGTNELHGNSTTLAIGATRPWRIYTLSLTASGASTALLSGRARQVFGLTPQVFVPLFPRLIRNGRVTATLGGKAVTGPDGRQFGASASVHWDFRSKPYADSR